MHTEPEVQFRQTESLLDNALLRDKSQIESIGITVSDDSARGYHYKNQSLTWMFRFEIRRLRGSDIEKVWVTLTMEEHDTTALRLWRRAELFQLGQTSRWQDTKESLIGLPQLLHEGIGNVIMKAISEGQAAASYSA